MTRMVEALESRELFSVTVADPTATPVYPAGTTDVVVEKKTPPKITTTCSNGTHIPDAVLTM
jgi:hypothetical protein